MLEVPFLVALPLIDYLLEVVVGVDVDVDDVAHHGKSRMDAAELVDELLDETRQEAVVLGLEISVPF